MKTFLRCGLVIALAGGMVTFLFSMVSTAQGIQSPQSNTIKVPDEYATIQAAINAADVGDTILVAAGVYTENLSIRKEIILSGGWSSDFTSQAYGDSTINGNYAGRTISITCATSDTLVTIEGFTIQNGNASGLDEPALPDSTALLEYPDQAGYDPIAQAAPQGSPAELSNAIKRRMAKQVEQAEFPGGAQAYDAFLNHLSWRTEQAQTAIEKALQPVSPYPPLFSAS
jgi:hypothetical protein